MLLAIEAEELEYLVDVGGNTLSQLDRKQQHVQATHPGGLSFYVVFQVVAHDVFRVY